jgi:hypothetical protein
MISADYAGTKDYREELARALEVARQRLSPRDFAGFSVGIAREIDRLDLELSKYYDVVFSLTKSWASLSAFRIPVIRQELSSIRFNSPTGAIRPSAAKIQQLPYFSAVNCVDSACAVAGGF